MKYAHLLAGSGALFFAATARLSVAMPLIFGLATIAAAPTVEAVTVDKVDIINASVDVDENAVINAADDLSDVALWCNDAAPVKVDIIDGGVDVNEGGSVQASDDLVNCDLTHERLGFPRSILDGFFVGKAVEELQRPDPCLGESIPVTNY